MNTTRRLTHLTMIAALAAAAVMAGGIADRGQSPIAAPLEVVQLETVVVTGHRASAGAMQVVELPMVVVTGKRATEDTLLAQKAARSAAPKAAV